jgi:hypothetical protein
MPWLKCSTGREKCEAGARPQGNSTYFFHLKDPLKSAIFLKKFHHKVESNQRFVEPKVRRTKGSSNLWFAVEKGRGRAGVVLKTYSTANLWFDSTWRLKFLQSWSFLNDLKVSVVALDGGLCRIAVKGRNAV